MRVEITLVRVVIADLLLSWGRGVITSMDPHLISGHFLGPVLKHSGYKISIFDSQKHNYRFV
jgi:hypothetical protein